MTSLDLVSAESSSSPLRIFRHNLLETHHTIKEVSRPGARYYETPTGTYPSVTTVLGSIPNPGLEAWKERVGAEEARRVTLEATNRGTRFHYVMEKFLLNTPVPVADMDYLTKAHFLQVRELMFEMVEEVLALEIPLYSHRLRTAGRCDCIAVINGRKTIVDFKTSKEEKPEDWVSNYKLQCAAYAFMANELFGLDIQDYCVIMSNRDESYPTIYSGETKEYLIQFVEVRKAYEKGLVALRP